MTGTPAHQPFVPDDSASPNSLCAPVVMGVLLGMLFGASSLYLVLKVRPHGQRLHSRWR